MTVGSTTKAPAMAPGSTPPVEKGFVERLLAPIADVHPGEATAALLLTLLMFLVLAAYYELKTAREVFILSQGGAEVKS
jgi:ATP:ADP antiporter, AAA family